MVTTYTPPREIDFSSLPESDGAPVAERMENLITMVEIMFGMNYLMEIHGRTRFAVGGNQLLFYNVRNGNDHLASDVYVALDVPPGLRATWKTWLEGKCRGPVMEITSGSTQDEDTGTKLRRYGEPGAREYYIYDHTLSPPLWAYRYVGKRPLALSVADGRVVDRRTGEQMLMIEEERRPRSKAKARAGLKALGCDCMSSSGSQGWRGPGTPHGPGPAARLARLSEDGRPSERPTRDGRRPVVPWVRRADG